MHSQNYNAHNRRNSRNSGERYSNYESQWGRDGRSSNENRGYGRNSEYYDDGEGQRYSRENYGSGRQYTGYGTGSDNGNNFPQRNDLGISRHDDRRNDNNYGDQSRARREDERGRYDDRNVFERAGDRIRETWSDWTNSDEDRDRNWDRDNDRRYSDNDRRDNRHHEPARSTRRVRRRSYDNSGYSQMPSFGSRYEG